MKKRIAGIILTLVYAFICMCITADASTSSERTWCFRDFTFPSLEQGYTTDSFTLNGLTLSSGLFVHKGKGKVKNLYFEGSIYTKANGSRNDGFMKFSVKGNTDIHILGKSKSDTEDRNLTFYTTADGKTYDLKMTHVTDDYIYKYRGAAGDVYLYTAGGGVRIYSITAKDYNAGEYAELGEDTKRIWDFEEYTEYSGSITENISFNDMEIKATAENPVIIDTQNSDKEPYGYSRHRYCNLAGRLQYGYRYITFPVNKNSDVYITAKSADGISQRKLFVWNKYYGTPNADISDDFINVSDKIETYKISYYGDGEDFMIGSEDSGIKIYKVSVVPRVNKIIDYKTWDISNNSSFALGEYKNNIIDGMEIINATVESNTDTGNKKAIHIKSRAYGDARGGKIKINVSDSSGKRGAAVKRTITIRASSKLNGMKIILISSDDFIIGSADLATAPADYKFDYTGSYDSIYAYSYYSNNCSSEGAYIYSIDNGDSGPIGPEDMEKTISVVRNESYRYFMTCNNIHNVSAMKYTIVYNPDALRITKIGENPNHIYTTGTYVNYDPSITIISNDEGVLSFEINSANKDWSGILCPVEFMAKGTGSTTVKITAEVIS